MDQAVPACYDRLWCWLHSRALLLAPNNNSVPNNHSTDLCELCMPSRMGQAPAGLQPTTTPCPTTTPPTCVNFACPAAWVKRPQAYNLQCYGDCTAEHCCLHPTTTPCPTTTPPTCVNFSCPA